MLFRRVFGRILPIGLDCFDRFPLDLPLCPRFTSLAEWFFLWRSSWSGGEQRMASLFRWKRMFSPLWWVVGLLLLVLIQCQLPPLDAECARCPCPQGYLCVPSENLCIRTENQQNYKILCADYLTKEDVTEQSSDAANEPSPDVTSVEEAMPEFHSEPTPETTTEENVAETVPEGPPTGQLTLHASCNLSPFALASERCGEGLRCVRLSLTVSVCLQDCSTNPDVCGTKRNRCRQIGWAETLPISVCVEEVPIGSPCIPEQSVFCVRGTSANPRGHAVCLQGTCKAAVLAQVVSLNCAPRDPLGPSECDITKRLACNAAGQCVEGVSADEGEFCGRQGIVCGPGLMCNAFDETPFVCRRNCARDADCGDPKAFRCYQGGCVQIACVHHQDCVVKNPPFNCIVADYFQPPTGECRPFPENGPRGVGEKCDGSTVFCGYPLNCIKISGSISGFCSLPCRQDADCTKHFLTGRCQNAASSGVKVCLWMCAAQSACPAPMVCLERNSSQGKVFVCGQL